MCSEFSVSVLLRDVSKGNKFSLISLALPVPVFAIERGTGEVLKMALERLYDVPLLSDLRRSRSEIFSCDLSCADRAASNGRAEDGIYAQLALPRLRMPCFAHIAATSQGRGLESSSADMTGMISGALAMAQGGQAEILRECVASVLLSSLVQPEPVINGPCFDDGHEATRYLAELLLICLPGTEAGKSRGEMLLELLTGDCREPFIQLRMPGGAAAVDLKSWAENVAALLLPGPIGLFPRHRWCNSLETVQSWSLLLNIHDLGRRAVIMWLSGAGAPRLTLLALPPFAPTGAIVPLAAEEPHPWQLEFDDFHAGDSMPTGAIVPFAAEAEHQPTAKTPRQRGRSSTRSREPRHRVGVIPVR